MTDQEKLDAFNALAATPALGRCRIFLNQAIARGLREHDMRYVMAVRKELAAIEQCLEVCRRIPTVRPPAKPKRRKVKRDAVPDAVKMWAVNLLTRGKRK